VEERKVERRTKR